MRSKILFCATVDYHFKAFHLPVMEWYKEQGWEVHIAAKGNMDLPFVDQKFDLPMQRSPIHKENIKAYKELKAIIQQQNYKIIHCHTPMGGVLARLAAREARKQGTKVIYTAHGFHFYKGASILNWLLFYPIEKSLSSITDCLITINNEDYQLAATRNFKAKQIAHVHGVGVDTARYKPISLQDKWLLRQQSNYKPDDFLMFYAAEFNGNKNQKLLIRALALIKEKVPNARLLLAGKGPLLESCRELAASLGVLSRVEFLGYRSDLDRLLPICDIAVASSLREGLPVNIMEAMACGLPIIATRNRGHSELVHDGKNGYIIEPNDVVAFAWRMEMFYKFQELRKQMGTESLEAVRSYSLALVRQELHNIYMPYMVGEEDESQSQYNRAYI